MGGSVEGRLSLSPAFQSVSNLMTCYLNLVMIFSFFSGLKSWNAHFQLFYRMKLKTSLSLKSWHFEASEDIMTRLKSQDLHIIGIKHGKASGSGPLPLSILLSGTWHFTS